MKVDLHVHSKHSTRPSQWVLQKLGCPESFVEPATLYRIAREKGMDMVTICDHNTIAGSLEISHLDNTFISEEITTFFPEDGCKIHVLAWDIDEAVHDDVQHIRKNIYELVSYLQQNNIRHGVAHPLFAVNDKLTLPAFEKLLLLFKNFEINGTRDGEQNHLLQAVLASLTPEIIEELANTYTIEPAFNEPWVKNLTAGSDDHSGLNIASIHTVVENAYDLDSFFKGLASGGSRPEGVYAEPKTFAYNLYGITYQFFKNKFNLGQYVNKDKFLTCLDRMLCPEPMAKPTISTRIQSYIHHSGVLRLGRKPEQDFREAHKLLRAKAEEVFYEDQDMQHYAKTGEGDAIQPEERWYQLASKSANRSLSYYADTLLDNLTRANPFSLFQDIASAGSLYTLMSPFFISYTLFAKDRAFCREVCTRFQCSNDAVNKPMKLAHFTDTFFDTNGVARTLQQHVQMAQKSGKDYSVLTCAPDKDMKAASIDTVSFPGVVNFQPVGLYDFPEYPSLKLFYPPWLEMLSYVYENGYTHLHSATPGPIGLAALLVSQILKLPISGTYHTALPQYAWYLTEDNAMEDMTWKFMVWYYNQMDKVYVPSKAFGDELTEKGVKEHKITIYPRGVDIERFTPDKRNGFFKNYSLNGSKKLLYVGRVSKEKNLHVLTQVYRDLAAQARENGGNLDLVIVGDGPYREEMEKSLAGENCLFTGYLEGDALAQAYASSDLFVFPSTTDTFGNVVLEAQASGLPVIVTDKGGPCENIVRDKTGYVVPGDNPEALKQSIAELLANPGKMQAMGAEARAYMQGRSFEQCFEQTWEKYCGN